MKIGPQDCCVLNGGKGAWAFARLAEQLSVALGIPISEQPRHFNYLLHLESFDEAFAGQLFIPLHAIRLAADKRQMADVFAERSVSTPRTLLVEDFEAVIRFVAVNPHSEWCLKYPTGCGANGHRLIHVDSTEPSKWPRPFIVQEFIRLDRPEVYRLYCARGELFGWVARRFPKGTPSLPWVAHARGALYELSGDPPEEAIAVTRAALEAAGLFGSFGCVDLLQRPTGEWVALEVGTDGIYNHVDRDLGIPRLEEEISRRIADAFGRWVHESD